jgi:hypothetical protein
MQPDANDIVVSTYGLDTNIFKLLYESLSGSDMTLNSVTAFFLQIWTTYSIIAFALSALFITGIIYTYIRSSELGDEEEKDLHRQQHLWQELHGGHSENTRWGHVQAHLESINPNDWKLAIIEADVLLERTLDKAGYVGATIGEKLKSSNIRSFATIDDAWQAHRIRNQIAHGGSDFVLTHKVAKEALVMYERVFVEFGVM